MKTITREMALSALNEAVKVKGYNYVYERREGSYCYNVWKGNPDCIVGHALIWLGVPIEWFNEDSRANDPAQEVCSLLGYDDMFDVEPEAVALFNRVQGMQDSGIPWGEAVTRAHLGIDWLKTALYVKDVSEFFTGSAALYQLVPPIKREDLDPDGNPYVEMVSHVVAADAMLGGMPIGTTLYQCDETGYVTSWDQLHPHSIADSVAEALASVGYEVGGNDE